MTFFKDISFWCIVLTIIIVMIVHHVLSNKSNIIEGQTNEGVSEDGEEVTEDDNTIFCRSGSPDEESNDQPLPEGEGSSLPGCCLYNVWYDIEDEAGDPPREIIPNDLDNLKTDGTWYMPLSMGGQAPTGTADDPVTWQECQQRCIDTPGCVYFNSFPEATTAPQGATCHITDGTRGSQMGENGSGNNPTSHSGRAVQLRGPIPDEDRKGLKICKCSAQGSEENRVVDDQGRVPVHENALQYGNINKPKEDCNASPRPNSCDVLDNSIPTALDTSKATHFRCLIESEVDDDLRLQAASMGIDVSNFSPTNFQENRELLLNRVTSRAALGLTSNATPEEEEAARAIRIKYQLSPGPDPPAASVAELNEAKLTRRTYYRQAYNISEADLDAAIQTWNDIRVQYGLDPSATPDELEEAMRLREAEEAVILRARYGLEPGATQEELDAAIQAYEDIRRQYNLPIDADDETLQAAIRDAAAREPLYDFTDRLSTGGEYAHTFTNCGKTGRNGPLLSECKSFYTGRLSGGAGWWENPEYFNVQGRDDVNGVQIWTVPVTGEYSIDVYGAQGGGSITDNDKGGKGARVKGIFSLIKGDKYYIIVGQQGGHGVASDCGASGGGGSYVIISTGAGEDDITFSNLLISAGGGGGAGSQDHGHKPGQGGHADNSTHGNGGVHGNYNTGGGGGLIENGTGTGGANYGKQALSVEVYGRSVKEGAQGGEGHARCVSDSSVERGSHPDLVSHGGFGGGGANVSHAGAGGGGCYGGDGAIPYNSDPNGKGGGSCNKGTPATDPAPYTEALNSIGGISNYNRGHGKIIITLLNSVPGGTV